MSRASQIITFEPEVLSEGDRQRQTEMVMKLFEFWKLTYKHQAIVLGLSPNTATGIYKYKNGEQKLPLFRDIQDRIGHLLAIHQYLRRAYSSNKELAYQWISTLNDDFDNKAPLQIIAQEGYLGLVRVRRYLELNQA